MKKIVIILAIILIGLFAMFKGNFLRSNQHSQNSNQVGQGTITTTTYEERKKLCDENSRINIRDKNNHYVKEVKQAVLSKTKISEPYFNNHFRFLCGLDEPFVRSIDFLYTVGEYSIVERVSPPNPEANINDTLVGFMGVHEISNVISKRDAIEAMSRCIGEGWASGYSPVDLREKGLYFSATNIGQKLVGQIDLETGECSKWPLVFRRD